MMPTEDEVKAELDRLATVEAQLQYIMAVIKQPHCFGILAYPAVRSWIHTNITEIVRLLK